MESKQNLGHFFVFFSPKQANGQLKKCKLAKIDNSPEQGGATGRRDERANCPPDASDGPVVQNQCPDD